MTRIKVSNPKDLYDAEAGRIQGHQVRVAEVDGLVDTGAATLVLPRDMCEALGLAFKGQRRVRYANGTTAELPWTPVQVEILGRQTFCDALVEAPGTTPLIGQIPLEALDLVVDPGTREIRVNPLSPDVPLLDLFTAA